MQGVPKQGLLKKNVRFLAGTRLNALHETVAMVTGVIGSIRIAYMILREGCC